MKCQSCETENQADARFCMRCGGKLFLTCVECGAENLSTAQFCTQCGTQMVETQHPSSEQVMDESLSTALQRLVPGEYAERLREAGGNLTAERRLVTILFSDVKGSTAMGESLDPEEVMEIMDGAFDVLIEPVYRHEGTLARLMGDAVLAFFGAPISHEDDPERAICAGLEIVAGAQEYAQKLEEERGIEGFNVRVGINTGLVVVGEVGSDLRVEYTAMGDAINLAARMEQHAPSGGVLITHETYKLVRGVFDVLPQEPVHVKGVSEPVQTYLVQRLKPRAFRIGTRGVEGIETRTVGRETEMLILENAFMDTLEDAETCLVTVVGEAGVGKTRLVDEFSNWVELHPEEIRYFKGRASGTTQSVPYSLWRDLFAYRFEILESDPSKTAMEKFRGGMEDYLDTDRADLVGELVGFDFSASPAVAAMLGSPNFGQLAKAYLVAYFREILAEQPVLIVLEDLQWSDDSSLDLVGYLVEEQPEARLFVIGAARPELYERRPHWGEGLEAYTTLSLNPLSRRATRDLVDEILQRVQVVPDALRELVVQGTEGNPYYVEELLKMLIEEDVIECGDQVWSINEGRLAGVKVPRTLTGILQARLDALPGAERAVLQRGSVVGRLFWDDVVRELSADMTGVQDIVPLLGSLRERELVFQREKSSFANAREYTFKHSVLRDVTYETVLHKLRRRYHRQAAGWLEAHAGERVGEYLGLIAGHYELGGEVEKAAGYLFRSGEEAYKVNAYRDAMEAFDRVLGLLPDDHLAERAQVLVSSGRALVRLGDFDLARERFEAGLDIAGSIEVRETEAAAMIGLGEVNWRQGSYQDAQRSLDEGYQIALECSDPAGQALAAQHLASVAWLLGDNEDALHWAEKSRLLYGGLGDRQGVGAALNVLGIVCSLQKELDKAERYLSDTLELAKEIGDRYLIEHATNNLGIVAQYQAQYDMARDYYEQALIINKEVGDTYGEAISFGNLADVYIDLGKYNTAWSYLRLATQISRRIHSIPLQLGILTISGRLLEREGAYERAAQNLGLVLHHPSTYSEVEESAQPVMDELQKSLTENELESALERGKALDLDQIVDEILAYDNLEEYLNHYIK